MMLSLFSLLTCSVIKIDKTMYKPENEQGILRINVTIYRVLFYNAIHIKEMSNLKNSINYVKVSGVSIKRIIVATDTL